MDFNFSPEVSDFRAEVHGYLGREHLTSKAADEFHSGISTGPYTRELWLRLGERRWLCPHWPREYGGLGLSYTFKYIVEEELSYFGTHANVVATGMAGPIILRNGTPEQRDRFLTRAARGEIEFALGYSEPQAGSDVASIQMRAVEAEGHFVLNGQKMFNTGCHYADYHWLLARTSTTGPKHKGLSFFVVDLRSPGITVKPLWVMGGLLGTSHRTNEVFYEDVEVPKECLVGEKNRGFYLLMEALAYERSFPALQLEKALGEVTDRLNQRGAIASNPNLRQKLAELRIDLEVLKLLSMKICWNIERNVVPDVEGALCKTLWGRFVERMANLEVDALGSYGLLRSDSPCVLWGGEAEYAYRDFLFFRVAGGTPEIMWNIVAQRGLGLPR